MNVPSRGEVVADGPREFVADAAVELAALLLDGSWKYSQSVMLCCGPYLLEFLTLILRRMTSNLFMISVKVLNI